MMETIRRPDGGVSIRATARSARVYLDHHSIVDFAKGPIEQRDKFVQLLERGADLMFSTANAAEIVGPKDRTSTWVSTFLDQIGSHWFPMEAVGVTSVMAREEAGADRSSACLAEDFVRKFFAGRNIQLHNEQRLDLVGDDFFRLSFVVDWLQRERATIVATLRDFDRRLEDRLVKLRRAFEIHRTKFDEFLPEPTFDSARPATFAWNGLVRRLAIGVKAFRFKKGDGADLCHAIMGSAYSDFATLDKQWADRVLDLPKPNGLARIYKPTELNQLLHDLEQHLAKPRA